MLQHTISIETITLLVIGFFEMKNEHQKQDHKSRLGRVAVGRQADKQPDRQKSYVQRRFNSQRFNVNDLSREHDNYYCISNTCALRCTPIEGCGPLHFVLLCFTSTMSNPTVQCTWLFTAINYCTEYNSVKSECWMDERFRGRWYRKINVRRLQLATQSRGSSVHNRFSNEIPLLQVVVRK